MSDSPRVVCDANTIVSAALFKGSTPDRALRFALGSGQLLLSTDTIKELQDVLARSKFDRYLTRPDRDLFLAKLIQRAVLVEVTESVEVCRDPRDDKYLALAAAGQASQIVSGDADLLILKSFRGIPILAPAQFLASVEPE